MAAASKNCTPKPGSRLRSDAAAHAESDPGSGPAAAKSVSLTVLPGPKMKKSKAAPWRAVVLILVHIVMVFHLVSWFLAAKKSPTGEAYTLSPVEPSDSMATLETGAVNAGFVFFVVAILLTALLGRFVCGWLCHIVAVQDFCAWLMKKAGIHPRPFRTRLLVMAPLVLALYMFVWPTLKREVVRPLVERQWGGETVEAARARWDSLAMYIGEVGARPGIQIELMTDDFWRYFPPWYVAIPFVFACGFLVVYFLGAKAFCTYGCPYGGFFGPADLIAPGKIKVNDDCNGCGHCTAVCTSNVRVHEEVRDFGKVVDPGCMKCLDCVSVCPNEALSFGFSAPTVFTRQRTFDPPNRRVNRDAAKTAFKRNKQYDLSVREEIVFAVIFFLFVWCFRGMLEMVPLLMAMALGVMAAYSILKLYRLATVPNVRLANWQIRRAGRLTGPGRVFVLVSVLYIAAGLWSGAVRWTHFRADLADQDLKVSADEVLARGYTPRPEIAPKAQAALRLYTLTLPISQGGFGWWPSGETTQRIAWLHAVLGNLPEASRWQEIKLERVTRGTRVDAQSVFDLARLKSLQGAGPEDLLALYKVNLAKDVNNTPLSLAVAALEAQLGRPGNAIAEIERMVALGESERPRFIVEASQILAALGKAERALELLARVKDPKPASVEFATALTLAQMDRLSDAWPCLTRAVDLAPENVQYVSAAAQLGRALGKNTEAAQFERRAQELIAKQQSPR